jgi:hypothetical protein
LLQKSLSIDKGKKEINLQVFLAISEIFNPQLPKSTIKVKSGVIFLNIWGSFSTFMLPNSSNEDCKSQRFTKDLEI